MLYNIINQVLFCNSIDHVDIIQYFLFNRLNIHWLVLKQIFTKQDHTNYLSPF